MCVCSSDLDLGSISPVELHRKTIASAFWNYELEQELREQGWEDFSFFTADYREKAMEKVDSMRAVTVYEYKVCPEECRRRGEFQFISLQ